MEKIRKIKFVLGAAAAVVALLILFVYLQSLSAKPKEIVTLTIYVMNDVKNEEHVLKAFEEQTIEELGIRVVLVDQPAEQYKRDLPNLFETQRNVDLVFDAPWISMLQNISKDRYLDLMPYLESGEYEGLTTAFSSAYLKDNEMDGKLYGLPVTKTFYDAHGIIYRQDLLESYQLGFDEITTLEQLAAFYDAVLDQNPDMVPLSVGKRGFFRLLFRDELELLSEGVYNIPGFEWPNIPANVLLSEDGTKVEDVVFLGDDASHYRSGRSDIYREAYLKQEEWSRYLSADSLMTSDNASEFLAGKAASYENTLGEGTKYLEQKLQKTFPEAKLGFYVSNTTLQGDSEELQINKGLTAWNYICIPKNSKHIEEALLFLDWLFASQEHNDLFTYGVEGVDWEKGDEEREYRLCEENLDRYEFPSYTMTYNPKYLRFEEDLNENEKRLILAMADEDNFVGSPLTGLAIDYSEFMTEYQALTELYADYHSQFMHGKYGDETEEKIREFHEKAEALGLERIREILITQIQEFLDAS